MGVLLAVVENAEESPIAECRGFSLLLSQINLVVGAEICEDLIHEPQEVLGGELIELNQGEVLFEGRLVETIHDHLTHGPGISTHRGAQSLATRQSE